MAGDIAGGIFAQRAAELSAQSLRDQISLVRAESEADIARYAEQAKDFGAKQRLAYLKSGVQLTGSPLDILDETVRVSSENIASMRAKAEAKASDLRAGATRLELKGRAAMVEGVSRATQTMISQYGKMDGTKAPKETKTTSTYTRSTAPRLPNQGFGSGGKLNLNTGF